MGLGLQQEWVWDDRGAAEGVAGAAALQTASLALTQLAVPGAAQAPIVHRPGAAGPSSLIPVPGCI